MGRLVRARHENRLDRTLQQLAYPRVLILDELGYLPLTREEASLFFRLLVRRCERASLIVTSNKTLVDWGEVFTKRRRWEPTREPADPTVGEQGTSYVGVFGTTCVGLDSHAGERDHGPPAVSTP